MSVTEGCGVENITSLVKRHVPKAQLSRQQEAELTFTLPFESMETFPGLASTGLHVAICHTPTAICPGEQQIVPCSSAYGGSFIYNCRIDSLYVIV